MGRILRPLISGGPYRALAFYVGELVLGIVAFVLLVVGWVLTLVFCITPLVVPLLIGLRIGVGLLAQAEAALVRGLLGVSVHPPVSSPAVGFWNRGLAVLRDPAFWKQQAHLLAAAPIALIPITVTYWALELVALPVWHRWADSTDVIGFIDVDSVSESLPFAAAGLVLLVVIAHLLGPYTAFSRRLGHRLLSGEPGRVLSPEERRARRLQALTIDALISTAIVIALVVIWALTSTRYFWPVWPLLALTLVVGIPGWVALVLERREISRLTLGSKAIAIQIGISAILAGFLVAVWAITTSGYFWPIWPILALVFVAVAHGAIVYARREHQIERLEESRAAAVDVQESELLRIERDLHDGAQARLVALGMSIGMAEEKLRTDPEGAQLLLAEARTDARQALEELRDLARGIRPPILTDRGLEAAIGALVTRAPLRVSLTVELEERPPAGVETAAYFVVAEALANAIKHSGATRVAISIRKIDDDLVAQVTDDGRGGADASGGGLAGLDQRVRALDGTLRVASPPGGPTTVRADLPCA